MRIDVILAPGTAAGTVERVRRSPRIWACTDSGARASRAARSLHDARPAARATRRVRLGVLPMSPYEKHPVKIADSLLHAP